MDNSLAAGRRLAIQVVLIQAAVAVVVGLGCLAWSVPAAFAAFGAGVLVALGTAVLALHIYVPALAGPGVTAMRFAVGTLLKWAVVLVGLYLIFAYWKLPVIPAVVGLIAALLVNVVLLKFKR